MVHPPRRPGPGRWLGGRQLPGGGSRARATRRRGRAPGQAGHPPDPAGQPHDRPRWPEQSLSDTTQGWSHTVHASLSGAANSSAEVIAEAPCCTASGGILPLADFGTVNFTSASADGSPIGDFGPTQIDMVDNSGRLKDETSSLSGGGSFSDTWLRAN